LSSPERARLQELQESILIGEQMNHSSSMAPPPLGSTSPLKESLVLYVPEVEEIRISPVIARKGYLNVLEHKTNVWKKRWVVSVFILFAILI
jgi:kinesin family protein 1